MLRTCNKILPVGQMLLCYKSVQQEKQNILQILVCSACPGQ